MMDDLMSRVFPLRLTEKLPELMMRCLIRTCCPVDLFLTACRSRLPPLAGWRQNQANFHKHFWEIIVYISWTILFGSLTHMLSMCRNSLQLLLLLLFSYIVQHAHILTCNPHWAMWSWSIPSLAVVEGWRIPSTTPGWTVSARLCWWNYMVRRGSTTGHSDPWNTNDHVRKRSEENGQSGYWDDGRKQ